VLAHNSFQTQSDLRQHFGLKAATGIDSLEIFWPSGFVQQFGSQNADRFYTITEGEQPEAVSAVTNVVENLPDLKISPNPIAGLFMVEMSSTSLVVQKIQLRDMQGKDIDAEIKFLNSNTFQVKLPEILPAGIYSFTLHFTSGQSISRSVVKK
jgi:hypothetical protein